MFHYHFLCPMCAIQYQPWAGKDCVEGKRVLTVFNPITLQPAYIVCQHPPSEDDRWLNNMVEVHARDIQTQEDVEAWMNRSALDLNALIQKEESHASQVWQKLSYDNQRKKGHIASFGSDFNDEPMMTKGYALGAFLPAEEASKPPFDDWKALIGILANHVAATKAFGRIANVAGHVSP